MAAPRVERRLAAILAADVVGYSALMERDEDRTLARLKAIRKELIDPLIAEYQGRVVKLMATAPWSSSPASSTRCAAPCSSSGAWPSARRGRPRRSASASGSASTWAT
jgi:class 3 adenylate cyclase